MEMAADSPLHRIFCDNLRARRKELGLTQAQVAKTLGVDQSTYSQIENGRAAPTLSTVERVALALDTSWSELLAPAHAISHSS